MSLRYINPKKFPPFLDTIIEMDPKDLPIDATARIMCQHCGLWNRAILCPPLLYHTYPQFKTIDLSKKHFEGFEKAFIYVFKNDGTKRWWFKKHHERFAHLELKKRKSRQLKGCEASSARELTRLMRMIRNVNSKTKTVECYIQGHCDLCARKCPNRRNPPCIKKGLPSMEATGINVYKLLNQLGVKYEYPVDHYLTQVTLMVVKSK